MPGLNGGNLFCVLSHIFVGFFPFNARDMHVEKAKTGESTARGGLSRDLFELPFLSQMPKDGENVFFLAAIYVRLLSSGLPRATNCTQTNLPTANEGGKSPNCGQRPSSQELFAKKGGPKPYAKTAQEV